MDFHIIQILGTNYKLPDTLGGLLCRGISKKMHHFDLYALGSGLHAPCDLSYDIEIYLQGVCINCHE